MSFLEDTNFMDANGEFQVELSMSSLRSTYEHKIRVSGQSIFSAASSSSSKAGKFETGYFSYGAHDWNVAVYSGGLRTDSQLGIDSNFPPRGDWRKNNNDAGERKEKATVFETSMSTKGHCFETFSRGSVLTARFQK